MNNVHNALKPDANTVTWYGFLVTALSTATLWHVAYHGQDLEFYGAMRFYHQDKGEKVSTKCIRVSSTATTKDVMAILIEKFRPDMRMLSSRSHYALYEVHANGGMRFCYLC